MLTIAAFLMGLWFLGLMLSYTLGLPFFRNTFTGDLMYTGVFFGAYELALTFFRSWKTFQLRVIFHP